MKDVVLLGERIDSFTHRAFDAVIEQLAPQVRVRWVATDSPDPKRTTDANSMGWPRQSHDDAVYVAIQAARTSGQPFLGTYSGFQYTIVEVARNATCVTCATER